MKISEKSCISVMQLSVHMFHDVSNKERRKENPHGNEVSDCYFYSLRSPRFPCCHLKRNKTVFSLFSAWPSNIGHLLLMKTQKTIRAVLTMGGLMQKHKGSYPEQQVISDMPSMSIDCRRLVKKTEDELSTPPITKSGEWQGR